MKLKGFHNAVRTDEIIRIKELAAQGLSQKEVAAIVGRSQSVVCNVVNGKAGYGEDQKYFDVDHYVKSVATI